jgi:hypothetical protein
MSSSVKKVTVPEEQSCIHSEKGKIQKQADKLLKPRGQEQYPTVKR